jgi:hypothetical protein
MRKVYLINFKLCLNMSIVYCLIILLRGIIYINEKVVSRNRKKK